MMPLADPVTADQDEVLLLVLVGINLLLVYLLLIYLLLGLLALRLSASSERPAPAVLPPAPVPQQTLERPGAGPDEFTAGRPVKPGEAGLSAGQAQVAACRAEVSAAGRVLPVQPVRREVSFALRPDYRRGLSTSFLPAAPGAGVPGLWESSDGIAGRSSC